MMMSQNKLHPDRNKTFKKKEEEISFIGAQNCCVSFVDIVDSTRVTSSINNPEKVRKYYEIFLNTMAAIARNSGAKIIKKMWATV
jgi:class 3 adenylate cyclase